MPTSWRATPCGTLNWRTEVCPPRDSKPSRNPAVCLPVTGWHSVGCASMLTVRCGVKLKNYDAHVLNQIPKNDNDSNSQTLKDRNKLSEAPTGFALRQSSGAFPTDHVTFPKAPEDWRSPRRKRLPALWEKILRFAALGLALLCLAATQIRACGPSFPNNLLDLGD